jgi:pyruvate,orthophosphate dikinase
LPISISQQEIEKRETDITLESHYPVIYQRLKEWANKLIYKQRFSPQEIEFTFESSQPEDLYLLQSRDMSIRERKKVLAFDIKKVKKATLLSHGIGVSGGAMSGRIVFSLDEIDTWRKDEPNTALILIRGDTVPDDIREIYAADGLVTARGGLTSHAAVVAHRLGKTCVVGCGNLSCNEIVKTCHFSKTILQSGDKISINGLEGAIYKGLIPVRKA